MGKFAELVGEVFKEENLEAPKVEVLPPEPPPRKPLVTTWYSRFYFGNKAYVQVSWPSKEEFDAWMADFKSLQYQGTWLTAGDHMFRPESVLYVSNHKSVYDPNREDDDPY